MSAPVIHWFRRDLRLGDNTALNAALESRQPVIPLFIFDERLYKNERSSGNRMAFLLAGLHKLDESLRAQGSRLLVRFGEPLAVLREVIAETGATALYFNRDYSPVARARDREIDAVLNEIPVVGAQYIAPLQVHTFHDLLMHPPTTIMSAAGAPLTVFTPFKKAWLLAGNKAAPHTASGRFAMLDGVSGADIPTLGALGFAGSIALPEAGEAAALRRLERFAAARLYAYDEGRNTLFAQPWADEAQGTSALSPYLRLGMLSVRQAYAATQAALTPRPPLPHARFAHGGEGEAQAVKGVDTWVSELVWREFYLHVLYHFPHVLRGSFRPQYDAIAWREDADELARWQAGMTGYPIVDAAMRQLVQMGWMHNRARMIVASFLCKDLLIYWREGERWFMNQLLDGDPAANNGGWQWTAGTGTDASPYFRIFNPVSQSQKFDPQGDYIRAFVPELRDVPNEHIHAPWQMALPPAGYPAPMIDHGFARERTLAAFAAVKGKN
jgi:deoxyribodipyrimidine photo-lyase